MQDIEDVLKRIGEGGEWWKKIGPKDQRNLQKMIDSYKEKDDSRMRKEEWGRENEPDLDEISDTIDSYIAQLE